MDGGPASHAPHGALAALTAAFAGLEDAPALLLAVSGGADSMALMHGAAAWAAMPPGRRPRLLVATVDHGLRPQAAAEADRVAAWAAALGLEHATLAWTGPKPSLGLQAAARAARYRLLEEHAVRVGATHVLTAHHAGDQAETLVMRLMRGSGPTGLGGMRPQRPLGRVTLARPFLDRPRSALVAALRETGQEWIEDPSNLDPRFARTAVRRAMPVLGAAGLTEERLGRLAARLQRLDAAAARAADAASRAHVSHRGDAAFVATALFAEPAEIVLRVLATTLRTVAGSALPPRLERIERLVGDLAAASSEGRGMTRTAAGCIVRLGHDGITIVREAGRSRGRGSRSPAAKTRAVV